MYRRRRARANSLNNIGVSCGSKADPRRGSGRCGGVCGCGCGGGGGVSTFSKRLSSGTREVGGDVYCVYFAGRRCSLLYIAEEEVEERLKKTNKTTTTTTDAGMRVLARTVACVCVRPCEAGAVTNYNNIASLFVWRARSICRWRSDVW